MEEGTGIGEIFIYETEAGQATLDVTLQQETVWLTLNQLSELFGRDKSVVSRHLKNIFQSEELNRDAVVANFATTASDGKIYQVDYYNLDVIISVGYRVNSKRGTQFRIWATNVLRRHLVEGYTLNEKRLKEQAQKYNDLKQTVKLLQNVIQRKELTGDESTGLLQVISDYTYALDVLDDYDHQRLTITGTHRQELFRITYNIIIKSVLHIQCPRSPLASMSYSQASGRFNLCLRAQVAGRHQKTHTRQRRARAQSNAQNMSHIGIRVP